MTEMMDVPSTTPKAPPISEMFQKFAIAFKTKTFEFFADETAADDPSDIDGFSLLDSAEDFIPDQKVIILKPDQPLNQNSVTSPTPSWKPQQLSHQPTISKLTNQTQITPLNAQSAQTLISSIFATVSSFEASYLQLQTAHVPFNEKGIKVADEALVSHLQSLSKFKQFYVNLCTNPDFGAALPIGSCLEAQVQENQSKLRVLGIVSDHLQADIDRKDNEVSALRKKLSDIQRCNSKLAKRLSGNLSSPKSCDVLLSVRVFDSVINDACRATHKFTNILIDLMRKAGWDLDLAANSVHADIEYAKTGHNRYAFLSYFCLGMFRGFDLKSFGLDEGDAEILCNGHISDSDKTHSSLKQLLEHVSSSPMELLHRNPYCEFSRFCEKKYQELIHATMESSIFSNMGQNEVVLNSWRSLSIFYESFVNMASAVWTLHKLAFSFDPVVEIFQVERGVDFSVVYMEDVTRRCTLPAKTRMKVGFTVVPGFKIGRTVLQSKVYLCGLKCTG
ncbi:protein GRAVITROPIC IN THE LIGHT 1 [Manihot esculenta]|uniref:Uncharacterized protein n=1 Tax=Manihot esculenta TaxID=3983 RepID=A0A2C9VTD5_MANES|nr:protein GRAVITROPIC IN THE LIGHT 1 [Manihot esculenta]OAY49337.1 hypothetical protein MANES_05G048100v8 [Manihot esculenta]